MYRHRLKHWQSQFAAAEQAVVVRTQAALSAWASALGISRRVDGLPGAAGDFASLAGECAVTASAFQGLQQVPGNGFGNRRVALLYVSSLGGIPPPGELTGDDVIVVTSFLPSAAAASAAQASLLGAGAAQASVVGPEVSASQLATLVTAGLSQNVMTEVLSGPALFANNSAALLPGAVSVLTPLLAPLREAGAAAVINGYASTPGLATANYKLSYARAAAVAGFFEAHGVPASSLIVVGHGASDLVAPGPSGANRRVTVVIEEPSS
jgi:outer membrane protein OmpA-like peptidoglycan-associated protein